jgi:hypothetical protein
MKVDVKLAELVPLSDKFAKQSGVGIFRNERTRSTPLDPKLMFWGVSDHFMKVVSEVFTTSAPDPYHWTQNSYFGAFWTISILHESRCKTGRTGAIIAQVR